MAEGRSQSLGFLFHSLIKREMIPLATEAWFPSEWGSIYTCHTTGQPLSLFAAAQNWKNSHQLHSSLSNFESGAEAVLPCQETGGKQRICEGEKLQAQRLTTEVMSLFFLATCSPASCQLSIGLLRRNINYALLPLIHKCSFSVPYSFTNTSIFMTPFLLLL